MHERDVRLAPLCCVGKCSNCHECHDSQIKSIGGKTDSPAISSHDEVWSRSGSQSGSAEVRYWLGKWGNPTAPPRANMKRKLIVLQGERSFDKMHINC